RRSSRCGASSASGAPHAKQKRATSGFSWPHARHVGIPASWQRFGSMATDRVLLQPRAEPRFLGEDGRRTNFALTVRLWFVVTLQRCLPLQGPDQPENLEPLADFAFRVTDVR